jgi:hypothetical protein
MLTSAKLSRWSISYYNDTALAAGAAAADAQRAGGGLGECYGEHDTRTSWADSAGPAAGAGYEIRRWLGHCRIAGGGNFTESS